MKSALKSAIGSIALLCCRIGRAPRKHRRMSQLLVLLILLTAPFLAVARLAGPQDSTASASGPFALARQVHGNVNKKLTAIGNRIGGYIHSGLFGSNSGAYEPAMAPPMIDSPTSLLVTGVLATRVSLSWTAPVTGGVDHYQIERSASLSSSFQPLTTVSGTTTSYNDDSEVNQHSYLY